MTAVLMRLKRRLTFANVASAAALFVALGGTSYAAITLPSNSVGSRQIRTGAVGTSEIRTGGVRKAEIATGGVGASELHTDSVRSSEIRAGAVGAPELAKDAVTGDAVKDGSIGVAKLDPAARGFHASSTKGGAGTAGNAKSINRTATGEYTVDFGSDVSQCVAAASPASVKSGTATEDPDAGASAATAPGAAATAVVVRTFDAAGAPADEPFALVLGC